VAERARGPATSTGSPARTPDHSVVRSRCVGLGVVGLGVVGLGVVGLGVVGLGVVGLGVVGLGVSSIDVDDGTAT
jgi:hypothetical protein